MAGHRLISVVIPVFDERDSLEELAAGMLRIAKDGHPRDVIEVRALVTP